MDRLEFIGKLNSIYAGESNAIDEIVSEYDRLNNIINKAIELLKKYGNGTFDEDLLEILQGEDNE